MAEGPQKPSANVRMFACLQPVGTGLCRITQQLHATHRYARARFCRTAVIRLVKDDLASDRLGQLCSEFLDGNNDGLQDYLVTFFLVATRPHGWADSVRKVINKKVQGSYFLLAVRMFMCYIYKYATMGVADVEQMRKLLEHILAKNFLNNTDHNHGHAFELDASKQLPERNEAELKEL